MAQSDDGAQQNLGGFEGLLIDLDGTLVDSVPDLAAALNKLLAEEGHGPLARNEVADMVGDGVQRLVERGFAARGIANLQGLDALVERFLGHYEVALSVESRPYPGVLETLDALKAAGLRLAVCTNKPQAASERMLADLELAAAFETVAGGDAFAVRKPDGGHLLGTLERLGVAPEAAAMLGDSHNDVAAARNAGLPVVLVSYGYSRRPAHEMGADAVIDRFEEIGAALARLGARG